jgi:hypothetical protein
LESLPEFSTPPKRKPKNEEKKRNKVVKNGFVEFEDLPKEVQKQLKPLKLTENDKIKKIGNRYEVEYGSAKKKSKPTTKSTKKKEVPKMSKKSSKVPTTSK